MRPSEPKPDAQKPEPAKAPDKKHAGPSGGFTASPGSPHSAVSGGVSPRFPANTDGKGDTPEGIG